MAKIEMDISEYEAMKENKRLLENSLEKERLLQAQINDLTDQKMKALEEAKMKVVKITKSKVEEIAIRKRDDGYILGELAQILGFRYDTGFDPRTYIDTDRLINAFFERFKTESFPFEEVTTHGLDEVRAEIRNELKSQMDNETIEKLKRAEEALLRNSELVSENRTLAKENNSLSKTNARLVEIGEELSQKLSSANALNETTSEVLSKIKDAIKDGYTFWNKSSLLDKIISIANS